MLAKRIIACLDVQDNKVVKGRQFKNHKIVGDIIKLSQFYSEVGIDELVFYDISASSSCTLVDKQWIKSISKVINIPFSVAGGISSLKDASDILSFGADKISINSPALNNPNLIKILSDRFGTQCVVVGIDSWYNKNTKKYEVFQYTGDIKKIKKTNWNTIDWVKQVQILGAGEIVLNTMNSDGMKKGFDIKQLKKIRKVCNIPLIASGGAGKIMDFLNVFQKSNVDGALAASVFHNNLISIKELKMFLFSNGVEVRIC